MKSYDSINTCPVYLFNQVLITGDPEPIGGADTWSKLYTEYLEEFGVSDQYKSYIQAKCEECVHEIEAATGGGSLHKTLAQLSKLEAEAIEEKSSGNNSNIYELSAILSKKMSFRVDPKEVTVVEFYNYLKCK